MQIFVILLNLMGFNSPVVVLGAVSELVPLLLFVASKAMLGGGKEIRSQTEFI